MAQSRRTLLKAGAAAGVAALVPFPEGQAREPRTAATARQARLAAADPWPLRSTFAGLVGSTFYAREGHLKRLRLLLSEVDDLPSARTTGTVGFEESFAVRFRGPVGLPLRQGTYTLRHASIGELAVFLVPVERPSKTLAYEAIFNRQTA